MPRGVVKLAEHEYVVWSTVVDSPVTGIWPRRELLYLYSDEITEAHVDEADRRGHSFPEEDGATAEDFVRYNRAGPNERTITLAAIRKRYKTPVKKLNELQAMLDFNNSPGIVFNLAGTTKKPAVRRKTAARKAPARKAPAKKAVAVKKAAPRKKATTTKQEMVARPFRPTSVAVRKHPFAVMLLTFAPTAKEVGVYDFEWADTKAAMTDTTRLLSKWAAEDVEEYKDMHHVVVQVIDTQASPIKLGNISVFGGDDEWRDAVKETITDDPTFVLVRAVQAKKDAAKSKARKARKGVVKNNAPKPKAQAMRAKKAPAKKAEPTAKPVQAGGRGRVNKAELQQRIAERKKRIEERAAARRAKDAKAAASKA